MLTSQDGKSSPLYILCDFVLATWLIFGEDTEMNPAAAYKIGMKYFVERI